MPVLMFHGLKDTALLSDALNNTWEWMGKDLTLVTNPDAGHFVQQDAARYDRVTAADVQRVAKTYLGRPKIVLTVVPEGKKEMMLTASGGGR